MQSINSTNITAYFYNSVKILSHILGHEFKICHSFGEYMHDWMPFRPFSLFFSRHKLVVRFNLIHMVSFIIIDCCHHCICGTYVIPIALFWTAAGDIRETVVNNLNVSSDEENPAAVQNKAMGMT
jgi:hypothetical protein